MRELMVVTLLVVGCGGGGGPGQIDGPPGQIDSPPGTPDSPPGTPDGPPATVTCAEYCTAIQANCTDVNRQYNSPQRCLNSCATWNLGSDTDMSGNTLGCRMNHAELAAGNPGLHCRHAGPGGDG